MQTAVISEQGHRWTQEDRYTLISNFAGRGGVFGGVFDGHSGSAAADYAARHLHQRFLLYLDRGESPERAFILAYERIDAELSHEHSGCTAATFIIQGSGISTANCGDSRIILVQRDKILQLSRDHRLDNELEWDRIQNYGDARISYPYVMSGSQGLMPTRSLGDAQFREAGIIAHPWTWTHQMKTKDVFLIAGCDGLFDVLNNHEVAELARRSLDAQDLVQVLKSEVLEQRMGGDNLTIIACRLRD